MILEFVFENTRFIGESSEFTIEGNNVKGIVKVIHSDRTTKDKPCTFEFEVKDVKFWEDILKKEDEHIVFQITENGPVI